MKGAGLLESKRLVLYAEHINYGSGFKQEVHNNDHTIKKKNNEGGRVIPLALYVQFIKNICSLYEVQVNDL